MKHSNFTVPSYNLTNNADNHTHLHLVIFGVQGIGLISLAVFGTIGNLLSIVILCRLKINQSSINILLIGLSTFDLVWVISSVFVWGLPEIFRHLKIANEYMTWVDPFANCIAYGIGFTAQTGSIYFTILITLERYIAVCHPLKAKHICTPGRAKIWAVNVIIFSILYNVPVFFEYKTSYNEETMAYVAGNTTLLYNPIYETYYTIWSYTIVIFLVPFLALLGFNIEIYKTMRNANIKRTSMLAGEKKSNSLAFLLFAIVITFFVCNCIFYPLVNFLEWIETPNVLYVYPFVNFFWVLNSSVNFIYYFAFGRLFRREFLKLFSGIFLIPLR